MQLLTLLLLTLLTTLTSATDCEAIAAQIPNCSKACMTPALFSQLGCKDAHDFQCLCGKMGQVQKLAQKCILKHCGMQSMDVAVKSKEVCQCIGIKKRTW